MRPPAWLTPAEAGLFARMPPADQFEGLAVAADLEAWGHGSDRDLLLAGLVHDAGKSLAPPTARYRVLFTVLEALAPSLVPRLAAHSPTLHVLLNHAALGAQLAAEAGLPDDTTHLIGAHHLPAADARLQALQHADARH